MLAKTMRANNFGGASVTIPLKEVLLLLCYCCCDLVVVVLLLLCVDEVPPSCCCCAQALVPHVDEVSDSVKAIGCLNTITARNGSLYADNTDWVAIYELVRREHLNSLM